MLDGKYNKTENESSLLIRSLFAERERESEERTILTTVLNYRNQKTESLGLRVLPIKSHFNGA